MEKVWGDLVDQVAFVNYNPWENSYNKPSNDIIEPCSDLWRRMFVWFDGKINPCDTDYKSNLITGNINEISLSDAWSGEKYTNLRKSHINAKRKNASPCNRCVVV